MVIVVHSFLGPVHGYGYHGEAHGFEGGMEGHEGGFLTHGGFGGHGFVGHGGYHDENPMARQFTPESPGVPTPEPMPENGLNGPIPGTRKVVEQ